MTRPSEVRIETDSQTGSLRGPVYEIAIQLKLGGMLAPPRKLDGVRFSHIKLKSPILDQSSIVEICCWRILWRVIGW